MTHTNTPKLKPCPFCGSKPQLREYRTADGTRFKYDGVHGQIECSKDDCEMYSANCFYFVEGEDGKEKLDMIKAWNQRAPLDGAAADDKDAEIARLRGALEEIQEGKGRYSLDPFEHARNTIDDMKEIARKALNTTGDGK